MRHQKQRSRIRLEMILVTSNGRAGKKQTLCDIYCSNSSATKRSIQTLLLLRSINKRRMRQQNQRRREQIKRMTVLVGSLANVKEQLKVHIKENFEERFKEHCIGPLARCNQPSWLRVCLQPFRFLRSVVPNGLQSYQHRATAMAELFQFRRESLFQRATPHCSGLN